MGEKETEVGKYLVFRKDYLKAQGKI